MNFILKLCYYYFSARSHERSERAHEQHLVDDKKEAGNAPVFRRLQSEDGTGREEVKCK